MHHRLLRIGLVGLAITLLLVIGLTSATAGPPAPTAPVYLPPTSDGSAPVPQTGRWIIQLQDEPVATYKGGVRSLSATALEATGADRLNVESAASQAYEAYLKTQQQAVAAEIQRVAPGARIERSYQVVLNGFAVRMSPDEAQKVRKLPSVKAVSPDRPYQLQMWSSLPWIGAPEMWNQLGGQAHAGEGVKVAVIDSGIYVRYDNDGKYVGNPCFDETGYIMPAGYPKGDTRFTNAKVIVAKAYFRPDDPPAPGENTPIQGGPGASSHGTHTAGTVACNAGTQATLAGVTETISGVAPRAWLMNYRVFYPSTSGVDFQNGNAYVVELVAAIEDAVRDGADVISNSWGSSYQGVHGWPDPMIQAAEAAIDAGVTMVFAVGNDGPDTGTIISPAMSPKVIGVGASTKPRSIASGFVDVTAPAPVPENLTGRPYGSAQFGPEITSLTGPELYVPVEKVDTSGSSLACGDPSTTLPAGSLTGKIALISRGVCQFSLKVWNAQNAGAIAAIVYNSAAGGEGLINMAPGAHASEVTIPSAFVARSMGLGMTSFYDAHPGAAMVQIDPSGREVAETPDQIIGFSSRGPTNDQYLKPDVVAPGVNVLSAGYGSGPNPFVGFGQVSGTSMATPHVAGAAALLKQLHPDWQPWQIKSALMSTAKVDGLTNVDGSPAMVLDRGAGRIDLTKAGDPGLTFDWPGVGFGTVHPGASAMVTINAKSVIGINAVYDVNIEGPASGVTFAVNVRSISLTAGGMASFQVSMTAAADAAPGDYEGMVMLHHGPHDAHIPLWVRVLPARSGAEVLLVDDDASSVDASFPNYSEYYTRTLEVLGVGYTYLDIGAEAFPPLDELSHYRTVLWFTGDNDSFNTSGFFTADLDRLAEWLDTGGRLLATGQNFADVSDDNTSYSSPTLGRSRIYHGYLGATWATGSVFSGAPPRPSAMGDAPVLGEMRIDLSPGGDGAGNQTSVEAAIPMTDTDTYAATRTVMPLVHPMGGTLPAGAHIGLGRSSEPSLAEERLEFLYRSVYLGFGLEGVNDDTGFTTREQLAGKLLDWLKDEVSVNLDGPYTSDAARLVTLHATATSSKGTIAEYRWDFGDGSPVATGTANTVTHVYPSSGRFTAKVMAVDSLGHSTVDSASISAAAVAEIPASASGYVDSLNRLGAYFGSGYLWTGQDTRPKTPRWLHGVVQFDLTSHIPAGATIVAAQVELTGRDVTYVSGQPFEVSLKLLDPNVDPGFAYLGYYQIHNASAVASAPMEAGSFGVGVANRFMFNSSAALAAFQSRLEGSGKASFRADGVLLAPYGRDIVGWDGRASAAPVLRIVYITE